jgi:hypothetical protein
VQPCPQWLYCLCQMLCLRQCLLALLCLQGRHCLHQPLLLLRCYSQLLRLLCQLQPSMAKSAAAPHPTRCSCRRPDDTSCRCIVSCRACLLLAVVGVNVTCSSKHLGPCRVERRCCCPTADKGLTSCYRKHWTVCSHTVRHRCS